MIMTSMVMTMMMMIMTTVHGNHDGDGDDHNHGKDHHHGKDEEPQGGPATLKVEQMMMTVMMVTTLSWDELPELSIWSASMVCPASLCTAEVSVQNLHCGFVLAFVSFPASPCTAEVSVQTCLYWHC